MVVLVQYKVHPVNTGLQWKNRFLQQPMKGVETGVCPNNDGSTRTLVDSNILNKKDVLWPLKSMLWLKTRQFILYDKFSTRKSNSMCTTVCWLLKGVETGDSRILFYKVCLTKKQHIPYVRWVFTVDFNIIARSCRSVLNI